MTDSERINWKIRASVIQWLRYDRRCPLVCFERSPVEEICRPDIIGVTRQWKMIEVEAKQSLADFKANSKKRGLKVRSYFPHQFYFVVPYKLAKQALDHLPDGNGLLMMENYEGAFGPFVRVIRPAKINPAASRLSKYQAMRMVMHQSGSLHRAVVAVAKQ